MGHFQQMTILQRMAIFQRVTLYRTGPCLIHIRGLLEHLSAWLFRSSWPLHASLPSCMVAKPGTWTLTSWVLRVTWISGRSSRTYTARQWVDFPGVPLAAHFLAITRMNLATASVVIPQSIPALQTLSSKPST